MSAPAQTNRLATTHTTTALYRACMSLSEEARTLSIQNEGMKRLGLNAQVLAAQTGDQGGALEVIVAEIGRLSLVIREKLESLGLAARELSTFSIELLHLAHRRSSFLLGWDSGIEDGSMPVYRTILDHSREQHHQHLSDLDQRLDSVATLIADLGRVAQQIPPVTTMIRIVSTEIKSRTTELLGTVEDLKSFQSHLDDKIERMRAIRVDGASQIRKLSRGGAA